MSLFKFKNKINSHVVFNNTVKQIVEEIQKIPKYNELKGNPEIVLMVCNCVENIITKKDGCNKKDIVIEVIKTVFNLNDVEIKSLGATIECFWSNGMIVKMKSVEKVGKIIGEWFFRKFL
jgi:hypothetical protein